MDLSVASGAHQPNQLNSFPKSSQHLQQVIDPLTFQRATISQHTQAAVQLLDVLSPRSEEVSPPPALACLPVILLAGLDVMWSCITVWIEKHGIHQQDTSARLCQQPMADDAETHLFPSTSSLSQGTSHAWSHAVPLDRGRLKSLD